MEKTDAISETAIYKGMKEEDKDLAYKTALAVAQTVAGEVLDLRGAKVILALSLNLLKLRWNA
jgi:hypothetical protein